MSNTYWNHNGKYQQEYNRMSELMPDFEYTDNKYMNLLITISKIYYRVYNDGDSFLDFEDRMKYIEPFENSIDFKTYRDYNGKDLEELVDRIIVFLIDKDLNYTAHIVYVNHDTNELSQTGKEGFKKLVSGTEKYLTDWVYHFVNNFKYKMVS